MMDRMQTDTLCYKLAETIRQISPKTATVQEQDSKMVRYGTMVTREKITSESWDRDNKDVSGKM